MTLALNESFLGRGGHGAKAGESKQQTKEKEPFGDANLLAKENVGDKHAGDQGGR